MAIASWGTVVAQSAAPQPQPSAISGLLQKQINEHHLASMTAVVIRADGVAVIGLAGVKRMGQNTAVSDTDLFHLGSNTKAFTATMIGRLVEAKKLTWSTTPLDVFPELKDSVHPALRSVTLEQLLSHHAGILPYEDTDDYSKFLQEHLKVLEGKESKFLTSETMQRLHTSLMKDKYALQSLRINTASPQEAASARVRVRQCAIDRRHVRDFWTTPPFSTAILCVPVG